MEREKELLRIFLKVSQMENTILRRMNLSSFLMVSPSDKDRGDKEQEAAGVAGVPICRRSLVRGSVRQPSGQPLLGTAFTLPIVSHQDTLSPHTTVPVVSDPGETKAELILHRPHLTL